MSSIRAKIQSIVVGSLLLILGGVVGYRLGSGQSVIPSTELLNTKKPEDKSSVDFSRFWTVWNTLENQYVDSSKLDGQKMLDGAIAGMVSGLGDPYTMYLTKDEQKRTSDDLNGSFEGVGIQLGYKNQTLAVVAPLKGLPAEREGILPGDLILRIKDTQKKVDRDTAGITLPDAVSLIRGVRGSQVTLTFLRENGQPFEKTFSRETIVVPSIELSMIEKNGTTIAHIALSQFGGRTMDEWKETVDTIVANKNVKGIILDVRGNPGGYLQDAIEIASEFVQSGVVVRQEGKNSSIPYMSTGKGRLTNYPVVVLLNKGSASASEIVSGALRDRKQAKLIGENSFGKGTVQDAQELPWGAGLHVTIAKWILPNGDWIHGTGLKPDIEVVIKPEDIFKLREEKKDPQLDKAVEVLLQR